MNDDRRPTDWPDDRLADAFRVRADARPTPSDLAVATMDRVRRVPRVAPTRDRFVRLGGIVGAAAVVAIVAVALVSRPTAGPIGSAGPTTFGLPVLSVDDAVAIRDSGVDDREIAIHGFLSGRVTMSCPFIPHPPNPTELRCAGAFTWLMSAPESIVFRNGDSVTVHGPTGPALNPGLALVDTTGVMSDSDVATPVAFIGHFDDRRADLCAVDIRPTCADTFIVDRIDRGTMQTVTFNDQAAAGQTDSEIDALINRVDSNLRIISRRVVAIENLGLTEPVYQATPSGTPSYVSSAAWVVTALPPVDAGDRAIARTFVIFDGTDIISEISRNGPVRVTLSDAPSSPGPTSTATPGPSLGPTPSPTPAQSAQATLSTLLAAPITVSQAIDHRDNHLDDTELAVSGYFIVPKITLDCAVDLSSPISPHCEDGVTWLAEQQPTDPAAVGGFTPPSGPKLSLVIRAGASMGLEVITSKPSVSQVIVLGHSNDRRAEACVDAMVCRLEFVVDRIEDVSASMPLVRVVRETQSAKDTPDAVSARILRDMGPALDSWLVVIDGSSLPTIDPDAIQYAAELADAKVVWIARRLVLEEGRPVVYSAYTADRSDRVVAETAGHGFELATTIDLPVGPADAGTVIAKVVDSSNLLVGGRAITKADTAGVTFTRRTGPDFVVSVELGNVPGKPNEVVVSWLGGDCDRTWQLGVYTSPQGGAVTVSPIVLDAGPSCRLVGISRALVLQFAKPTRAGDIQLESSPSGG
jgi:hypothetical protein